MLFAATGTAGAAGFSSGLTTTTCEGAVTGGSAIGDGIGCAEGTAEGTAGAEGTAEGAAGAEGTAEGAAGAEGAAEGTAGAEGSGAGGSDGAGIGGYSAAIEIPDCVTSRKEEITISESVVTFLVKEPLITFIFTLFLALMFGNGIGFCQTLLKKQG